MGWSLYLRLLIRASNFLSTAIKLQPPPTSQVCRQHAWQFLCPGVPPRSQQNFRFRVFKSSQGITNRSHHQGTFCHGNWQRCSRLQPLQFKSPPGVRYTCLRYQRNCYNTVQESKISYKIRHKTQQPQEHGPCTKFTKFWPSSHWKHQGFLACGPSYSAKYEASFRGGRPHVANEVFIHDSACCSCNIRLLNVTRCRVCTLPLVLWHIEGCPHHCVSTPWVTIFEHHK